MKPTDTAGSGAGSGRASWARKSALLFRDGLVLDLFEEPLDRPGCHEGECSAFLADQVPEVIVERKALFIGGR
jgi:hypothetical protein